MEIIYKDLRKGEIKVKITDSEDFWYLSNVLETGDIISGEVERRIQLDSDRSKSFRKKFYLDIKIEKFEDERVLGIITNSKHEEAPNGEHQSLNLKIGDAIKIKKESFYDYQIEYLNEASEPEKSNILIVVLDRENMTFALLKKSGYEILTDFEGNVEKKVEGTNISGKHFYDEGFTILKNYVERYKIEHIVLGSPAFWKEEFAKKVSGDLKKKIVFVNCNNVGENGINEVIKRPEIKKVLGDRRISKEEEKVERILTEIKKEGNVAYGLNEVKKVSELGAIEEMIISSKFIDKKREENSYSEIQKIMKLIHDSDGKMFIINSENNPGKQLDGFGGIAAILRWKV